MSTQAAKHSSECSVHSVCVAFFSLFLKKNYRIVLQELEVATFFNCTLSQFDVDR